jgi:hypothetical protein
MGTTPQYPGDQGTSGGGSQLRLNPKNATPPVNAYVDQNTSIEIRIWTATANCTVQVTAVILLPDGTISNNVWNLTPTNNRTPNNTVFPLTEGFLLSVTARETVAGALVEAYCNVSLTRGSGLSLEFTETLMEGWLSLQQYLSWPPGIYQRSNDGNGYIISITGTTPGAGAEISEVVPAHAMWRPIAFRYALTSSAAAATRQSDLRIDDGTNVYAEVTPASSQAASLTQTYNWMSGVQGSPVANGIVCGPLPQQLFMYAGHRLRTNTPNLQAGDQYTAPQYLVEEWLFQ